MKIVQIGIYPPPLGGISVHIKRLKQSLEGNRHKCVVLNEGSYHRPEKSIYKVNKYSLIFRVFFSKADVYHFHSININIRMLLGLLTLVLGKNIVLTIHGDSLINQLNNQMGIQKKVLIWSLSKINHIICVNNNTKKQLIEIGFNNEKISTIPAFLKPIKLDADRNKIPAEVWDFIDNQNFLIAANGNVRFHNETDLYGIDMLIELIYSLNNCGHDSGLLFALLGHDSHKNDEKIYYETLKRRVIELGLQKKIFFYEVKDSEFYPILIRSNLFIRPTNTDGYGVSIAEALSLGVPSIASDVCGRPEGTILFKSRNQEELYEKTSIIKENYAAIKKKTKYQGNDCFLDLVNLYQKLTG